MEFRAAKALVTLILVAFAALELWHGRLLQREHSTRRDLFIDAACTLGLPLLVVPTIFSMAPRLSELIVPGRSGALAHLPMWAAFGLFLLADDLTQYCWHRLSHRSWLYPLHRAHHSARYLSVRVVYRNHLIYYLFMPGIWLSAILVYQGLGATYAVYIIAKMAVIIGAHSSVPWDAPLYDRFPRLMWVVERLISTPATHSAHHGLHEADGVTHYKGNYGNFLFLWDVLFGTARITRQRPETFGIEGLASVRLGAELLWLSPSRPSTPSEDRSGSGTAADAS